MRFIADTSVAPRHGARRLVSFCLAEWETPNGCAARILFPVVALVLLNLSGSAAQSELSDAQIVFIANMQGSLFSLYIMNPDGTHIRRIDYGDGDQRSPNCALDGRHIFISRRTSGLEIGTTIDSMNADGSNQVVITDSVTRVPERPNLSPNGLRIAYIQWNDVTLKSNLFIMNADSSDPNQIVERAFWSAGDSTWAPDGDRLIFEASSRQSDLFVVNADGTGLAQLTTTSFSEQSPSWSPDGTRIV